jgi:hypothetical protein
MVSRPKNIRVVGASAEAKGDGGNCKIQRQPYSQHESQPVSFDGEVWLGADGCGESGRQWGEGREQGGEQLEQVAQTVLGCL